jgi:hypothetical protein
VPPPETCANPEITRFIGNIGDEGNAVKETGGSELYSIPLSPPEPLGGDDYNGKFIQFIFKCPNGEPQYADPIFDPVPPTPNSFLGFGTYSATRLAVTEVSDERRCSDDSLFASAFTTSETQPTGTFTAHGIIVTSGGRTTTTVCSGTTSESVPEILAAIYGVNSDGSTFIAFQVAGERNTVVVGTRYRTVTQEFSFTDFVFNGAPVELDTVT